ncbi:MAG: hypothetical protein K8S99_06390 [Planctomycetes bacterium]|nr:hypothetical protein [Planctomycetota bacterium]
MQPTTPNITQTRTADNPALLAAARRLPVSAADQPAFQVRDAATDRRQAGRADEAHRAAQQLVSSTLVLPILQQARKDPFKSELFHGGKGEDLFGANMDQIFADRITSASNFPLVDAVYRAITKTGKPGAAPAGVDLRG